MNLYFISGLAADDRMFERLQFPAHVNPLFLPWLKPLSKDESLDGYVHRMTEGIDQTKSFALMGLSFGGMVCCEMNVLLKPEKTILISSVCSHRCFPPWFHWAGKVHLENSLRPQSIKATPAFMKNYLFGATSTAGKSLLADTLKQSDNDVLIWSIRQITNWHFNKSISNLVQIHGSKDKIFPMRYLQPQHVIEGGGHLTVFENAAAVSACLKKEL